ncbi:CdaR family protein [Desulfopila aestuarii]|uniref:YbbR domain-containing protein n=1 Tax=Desulfopila aestuarii DSM 18488 TaxID=1121416 RepID=A0A1M7Y1R0_9BACT|nr:CdaR family protein [Desulfopila aestuarii]SHO45785.1 YbbR domain-containing protein [Desulfopila aestuarii DSM 18488]
MEKLVLNSVIRFGRALFSAKKWQRIWSKEWVLKFISLLLATLLWSFVGGEDIVDKNVMVPIEIINLPRDLVISNQFKKEIEVTLSGPRSAIQEMANKAVSRQINLSNATPGTNVVENDNTSIPVPRGVTVLRIQPTSIILSLDKLIQKQFPVTPVTSGDVAAGFVMEKLVMNPDVINITGPETILSQADELMTEIIDINGLKESRNYQVPLDLEPSFVELIGQTSVTAEITVKPKMVEKKISKVNVEAFLAGERQEVAPTTADVILRIPVLLLRDQKDLKSIFSISAAESADESGFLKLKVVPNERNSLPIEVVSIIPQAVKVVNIAPGTPEEAQEENGSPVASEEKEQQPKTSDEGPLPVTQTIENVQIPPDDKTIIQLETTGEKPAGVKILPIKTKKKKE